MAYVYRNILKEPPTEAELLHLAKLGGLSVAELINPKSKALKNLDVAPESLSDTEAARLLQEQPQIMFRPLFTDGEKLVVGFKPEQLEALLQQ